MIKWRCKNCGRINESNPKRRWHMDMCKCGESGVDAEEHYTRFLGEVEFLKNE